MKLHFVLQQLDRAIFSIYAQHSKEAVKQYLYAAKAELKRFRYKNQYGDVTCSKETEKCPFLVYDDLVGKNYCNLSRYYLQRDEDEFLEPREGCTWRE